MNKKTKALRGTGLIIVFVITVLVLLATVAFYQSNLASSVSMDADTLVNGDISQLLVQSAVEEAVAKVESLINCPSSQLFHRFREVVYHPDLGRIPLGEYIDLPETKAMMATPGYEQFQIEEPVVEVVLQRQLDKTEYERLGIIKFTIAGYSTYGFGRTVRRVVEVTKAFKVVLTTIPRPYDCYGLYFAKAKGVTDVNSVNGQRDTLIRANERLWSAVKSHCSRYESAVSKALIGRLLPQQQAKDRCKELPSMDAGALMGLYYPGVTFRLDTLDLGEYLQDLSHKVNRELGQVEAAIGDESQFIAKADSAANLIFEGIWRIWAFSQAFRVIKPNDRAFVPLQHYAFSFAESFWQRRIQYRVKVRPGEKGINEAFSRFQNEHKVLRGVIHIDSDKPLKLKGAIKGQAVIVVGSGGVTLENINKNGGETDILTIVANKGAIEIKGECHCSIFLGKGDAKLRLPRDSSLLGSLVAWERPLATSLQGMIKRDMRYVSGFNGEQGQVVVNSRLLHVALSPKTIYRKVSRK